VNEVGTWKIVSAVLALACIGLLIGLLSQRSGASDTAAAMGASMVAVPKGPAPVILGAFTGDPSLVGALETALKAEMTAAAPVTYSSPGVTSVTINAKATTTTAPADDGTTNIDVKVRLLVTKQPGTALLGSFGATVRVNAPGSMSDERRTELASRGVDAGTEATFADVLESLRD